MHPNQEFSHSAQKRASPSTPHPCSRGDPPFSMASPTMILPPRLLVFSTDNAVLSPCSCFPSPWPSRKPYFCMILCATVPLGGRTKEDHVHLKSSAIGRLDFIRTISSWEEVWKSHKGFHKVTLS